MNLMKMTCKREKQSKIWFLLFPLTFSLIFSAKCFSQSVEVWLTKGDQTVRLEQQAPITLQNTSVSNPTISIDDSFNGQSVDGFGFMLTQASAEVISSLNEDIQNNLLTELFDPNTGNSISMLRISIGASDLSNSVYTYNETDGDTDMDTFSLDGPDKMYLIPILKKILLINPEIKILATPWTPPTWMKTNNSWIGGSLETQYYAAYASYFVKYLETMDAEGISIWGITPQNEPENGNNEPSLLMNSAEQLNFINNHLGPAIESSGYTPKIIAFDHNCDNTLYPIDVLNNSSYVDGAAFHLYAGDISALSTVRNQTGKNVYFTEQFTSSNGDFNNDLGFHMENVVIGSLKNGSKTVIEWNLATNTSFGPRTPGGCDECLGGITVIDNNTFSRNVSYYIVSQISKFVKPGAVRLGSDNQILNVAFKNPDDSRVLLVYNLNDINRDITVNWEEHSFQYNIPARSAITFVWNQNTVVQDPIIPDGTYKISSSVHNEVVASTTAPDYDAFMTITSESDDQLWDFIHQGDDVYTIQNKATGNYLGIKDNWCDRFGDVQARFQSNDTNIRFKIIEGTETDSYVFQLAFTSNCTGSSMNNPIKAWDIQDGASGGQLQTFDTNTSNPNQQFALENVQTLSVTYFDANNMLFSVFPNPAKNKFIIDLGDYDKNLRVQVINLLGRIVSESDLKPHTKRVEFNCDDLAEGMLFVRLVDTGNRVLGTTKILVSPK